MPENLRSILTLPSTSSYLFRFAVVLLFCFVALTSGCRTVKDLAGSTRFSLTRQEALVIRIEETAGAHLDLRDQLAIAEKAFAGMQTPSEETLSQRYKSLSREYIDAERRLKEVESAIERMEEAAQSFLVDWERRLYEYADPALRLASREQMESNREEYEKMVVEVNETRDYSKRVFGAFGDQVRFLRHNLNEEAVETLRNPAVEMKLELRDLMEGLEATVERLEEIAYLFRVE